MDKTKFTLGKFSFPVFFLQPTVLSATRKFNVILLFETMSRRWREWVRKQVFANYFRYMLVANLSQVIFF
jgi:hypothetical protein